MRAGRRLLQALEQRVGGRLGHQVGVVDQHQAPLRFERQAGDLLHGLAHLVDLDARAPGLDQQQVGMQAMAEARGVVGRAGGGLARRRQALKRLLDAPAVAAGAAAGDPRLVGRALAQQPLGQRQRQGLLAHAVRAAEQQRGRDTALVGRAHEQRAQAFVADDLRPRHAAPAVRRPRPARGAPPRPDRLRRRRARSARARPRP